MTELTIQERIDLYMKEPGSDPFDFGHNSYETEKEFLERAEKLLNEWGVPKYKED